MTPAIESEVKQLVAETKEFAMPFLPADTVTKPLSSYKHPLNGLLAAKGYPLVHPDAPCMLFPAHERMEIEYTLTGKREFLEGPRHNCLAHLRIENEMRTIELLGSPPKSITVKVRYSCGFCGVELSPEIASQAALSLSPPPLPKEVSSPHWENWAEEQQRWKQERLEVIITPGKPQKATTSQAPVGTGKRKVWKNED